MWYYPSNSNYPLATMIGSPNYGYRSTVKDLEAQVTIVTKNKNLQRALHEEQKHFFDSSLKVSDDTFNKQERLVPRWVKLVVGACKRFF